MSELAERIGVTKATLYSHYPSKEALLLELFEEALEQWRASGAAALAAPGPLVTRLREHLEAALQWIEDHPHQGAIVQIAATQVGGDLGSRLRARLDELDEQWARSLQSLFAAAAAAGELDPARAPASLGLFSAVSDGLFTAAVLRPQLQPRPRERLLTLWPALEHALTVSKEPIGS